MNNKQKSQRTFRLFTILGIAFFIARGITYLLNIDSGFNINLLLLGIVFMLIGVVGLAVIKITSPKDK